ncbi:MAG TPA: VCBS repeat-containing protein [Pyrinomonadaceae bacterium]|nr:VCBS repeat-containing protein [Pyrinomonadaceae bacterium]
MSVTLADLNNDNKLDAITTVPAQSIPPNTPDADTLSVQFGNGDGTFRPRRSYALNSFEPFDATVADFNRDGWRDIAVANAGSYDVTVLLNNGNGTF